MQKAHALLFLKILPLPSNSDGIKKTKLDSNITPIVTSHFTGTHSYFILLPLILKMSCVSLSNDVVVTTSPLCEFILNFSYPVPGKISYRSKEFSPSKQNGRISKTQPLSSHLPSPHHPRKSVTDEIVIFNGESNCFFISTKVLPSCYFVPKFSSHS